MKYKFNETKSDAADPRIDNGLSLAHALWSRSSVLLALGNGDSSLADMQHAIENGLGQAKQQSEYYCRLAKANARKYEYSSTVYNISSRINLN